MPASLHFKELLRKFNEHQVRYLIVGAYAVMKYTEPRYTKDLDVWVEPTPENSHRVFRALAEFGAPMNGVNVEDFTNPEVVFQIGIAPHRIDVLMDVKGLAFPDSWERRHATEFEGEAIDLVCKPDLIVAKEAAGRPQDMIDLTNLRKSDQVFEDLGPK